MNSIITLKNTKTGEKALVYREVYNSTMDAVTSAKIADDKDSADVSDLLWRHIKHMSHIINQCIRERIDITIAPK